MYQLPKLPQKYIGNPFSLQISKSRRYFSTFFQVTSVTLYSKCPFLKSINYQDERKRRLLRLEFADRRILRRWKGYRCCQDAPSCPCCQDEPFCSCLKAKIVFFFKFAYLTWDLILISPKRFVLSRVFVNFYCNKTNLLRPMLCFLGSGGTASSSLPSTGLPASAATAAA